MFLGIWRNDSAIIRMKWSKTNQFRDKVARISIPGLPGSPLCPVTALRVLLQAVPGVQDDPLFTIFKQGTYLPLTSKELSICCTGSISNLPLVGVGRITNMSYFVVALISVVLFSLLI